MSIHMAFRLGVLDVAVPSMAVLDVTPCPVITPVPRGPAWLKGVAFCQERITPVIDLATLFEIEFVVGARSGSGPWLLCVASSRGPVAWTLDSEPVLTQDILLRDPGYLDDILMGIARTLIVDIPLMTRLMDLSIPDGPGSPPSPGGSHGS
jgi:hypothetical protein